MNFKKILSVIATTAILFNSVAPYSVAFAQEITPEPTPVDTSTTVPSDEPTVAPTELPTDTPPATIAPNDEPTVEPTVVSTDQPVVNQDQESNPTTQGPSDSTLVTASPSVQPTQTPQTSIDYGDVTTTVVENIDLSTINLLNSNVDGATVTTDAPDYSPTSVALITGTGLTSGKTYTLVVSSTDAPPVTFTDAVTADSQGSFSFAYQLDGNYRPNYKVEVKDGSVVVASTTFTDSNVANDISQCQNGGVGNPLQPCNESDFPAANGYGYEGNANANSSNSHWSEGEFVPLRIVGTNYSAGAGNVQFSIDVTKGGKHAYDYVGNFDSTETTAASSGTHANHNNPVTDLIASATPTSPDSVGVVPAATLTGFPVACGSNTFGASSQIPGEIKAWGTATGSPLTVTYVSQNVGSSDCSTTIQVAWTDTKASFGGTIVIAYGAHIAKQSDWGSGNSAINISGSPYHTSLVQYTTGGVTKGIGQQDAKLSANAVSAVPTSVTTAIHDASHNVVTTVNAGSTVHDSATVTGNSPTGNVIFNFYNNGTCSNAATATSNTFALSNGAVDATTFTQGPLTAGSYSFKAHYNGDVNNLASDGVCEPLTVAKFNPGINTTPNPASGNVGVTLNDSASLTGGYNPTGSITFKLYSPSDATCANTPALTNSATVSGNGNYNTPAGFVSNASGVWHWSALYSEDIISSAVSGLCSKAVTLSKYNSTTVTSIHDASHNVVTSVNAGSTVHDSAAVSGAGPTPTGTVDFTFYSGVNNCSGQGVAAGNVSLVSGVAHPSTAEGPLSAGAYSFKAHYNGDVNYNSSDAVCEPLSVTKVDPSINTTPNPGSGDYGTTLNDSALLSGGINPTGSVTFSLFNPSDAICSGTASFTNSVTVNGNGTYNTSAGFASNAVGIWHWKAVYGGDGNNNSVTSACTNEPVTINKLNSSTVTTIFDAQNNPITSISAGTTIHDSATVTGSGPTATGNVNFRFYSNNTCNGDGISAGTVALNGSGIANPSSSQGPLNAGSYSFKASYVGDNIYNSSVGDCEPLTVNKVDPQITTTIHNSDHGEVLSISAGGSVHDSATVTGDVGTPSGTINFTFFNNNACTGEGASAGAGISLLNGVADPSTTEGSLNAGSYSFQAHYNGDGKYNELTSDCEPLTVNQVTPTIETTPNPGTVALGGTINDSAVLGAGVNTPSGTILFSLYDSSDSTCQNAAAFTNSVSVSGNGNYNTSSGFTVLAAGIWHWVASYSGDLNNKAVSGDCSDEAVTVNKADLGITTEIHNSDGDTIVSGPVVLGSTLHDSATVSGIVAGVDPVNPVTFRFFNNNECIGEGASVGSVALVGNLAHPSNNVGPLNTGSYSFRASIAGDTNYNGKTSSCEPFSVTQAETGVTTEVHNSAHEDITNTPVVLGTEVHDSSDLSGKVGDIDPTGTVTYHFFTNGVCEGESSDEIVTLGSESSTQTGLGAGSYSYKAEYNGDKNYSSSVGSCEPFSITKANTTTATQVHNANHQDVTNGLLGLNSVVHDSATVETQVGDFVLGGTVTYNFYNNGTCSGEIPFSSETVNIGSESSESGALGACSYSYLTSYSGDDNYNSSIGICEPFTVINPNISISKSNNAGSASAGSTVTYTLTLQNAGNVNLNNVIVTNVVPGGFNYVLGSTSGATTTDPTINGSQMQWNIGTVLAGNSATIQYDMKLNSDLTDGTYTNFATCTSSYGRFIEDRFIQLGSVDCNTASSIVTLGSGRNFGGSLQGQVLGASTELPATGSPTALVLIALGLIGSGYILKKKYAKN